MRVVDHLEKGSERAVHDVLVQASRSEVQRVEIASEVRRARDDHAEPSRMKQQVVLGGTAARAQFLDADVVDLEDGGIAGDALLGRTVAELIAKAVMEAVLRR